MKYSRRQITWIAVVVLLTALCYVPPIFHFLISQLTQPWGFFAFACAHSLVLILLFAFAPTVPEPKQDSNV
jgi:hypothetical protein